MKIHLTKKQINNVLLAIGNWTICEDTLKDNYEDKGKSLKRAERKLLEAYRECDNTSEWSSSEKVLEYLLLSVLG